jgi:hypothetical protein
MSSDRAFWSDHPFRYLYPQANYHTSTPIGHIQADTTKDWCYGVVEVHQGSIISFTLSHSHGWENLESICRMCLVSGAQITVQNAWKFESNFLTSQNFQVSMHSIHEFKRSFTNVHCHIWGPVKYGFMFGYLSTKLETSVDVGMHRAGQFGSPPARYIQNVWVGHVKPDIACQHFLF